MLITSTLAALDHDIIFEGLVCINNQNYQFNGKTCDRIREKESLRQTVCAKLEVHLECPLSCGSCCEDDPNFTFTSDDDDTNDDTSSSSTVGDEPPRTVLDCEWLASKKERQEKWCNKELFDRSMIRKGCPKTCDFCMDHAPKIILNDDGSSPEIQ